MPMDQIHLDPQDKLPPHPLPLGHIVNKTPSTHRTKKCLQAPPQDNFWNSPKSPPPLPVQRCSFHGVVCLFLLDVIQHHPPLPSSWSFPFCSSFYDCSQQSFWSYDMPSPSCFSSPDGVNQCPLFSHSSQHFFISHSLCPTDLLHSSPHPHLKTL